jgi:flagellar biosynthesis protein FlhB
MAEDQESEDQSQKTEEATAHRLEKAREKGQLAFSKEINHWFMILGLFLTVAVLAPIAIGEVAAAIKPFLAAGNIPPMEGIEIMGLMQAILLGSLKPMSLIFLVFIVAGLIAGFAQTQFLISFESIKPKLSKLSILQGFKRIFSGTALVEFAKGMAKIIIVSTIFLLVLIPDFYRLNQWGIIPIGRIFEVIQTILIKLLLIVLAILGFVAGLDYMYQRFAFLKKMRMSKQEIKEEHKETEGDPIIKRRLAELRREKSQKQRIATAVPEASVVITNPTHFAVALKYSDDMDAPKCVAKGADLLALSIRTLAEEHDIPIIEDPPLARALFAGIEVDDEVPEKYYAAVARVIRYIMGMDKVYREADLDEEEGVA